MYCLYASKPGVKDKLVAAFDSEQQLLAYVQWATLGRNPNGTFRFEQGSVLASYQSWKGEAAPHSALPDVEYNPSPSML